MGLFDNVGQIWTFARKVEDLFVLQRQTEAALDLINGRLSKLESRMTDLEADQRRVIAEAKSAATSAASVIASATLVELATRLTRLELRQLGLSPPPGIVDETPKAATPE